MTKDELLIEIQQNIKDYLPEHIRDACTVEITEVMKNNDEVYKGLTFRRGENVPCPTFYLKDIYSNYVNGATLEEVMEDLAFAVEENWDIDLPIEDFVQEYEKIKDKLGFQLVDALENKERLKECVNTKLGNDLAMIYYIEVTRDDGFMKAIITNDLAEEMNYDVDQLKRDAFTNMEKMHPATLLNPPSVMLEIMEQGNPKNLLEEKDVALDEVMYVLTTEESIHGASAIMYSGIMEKLGNMVQGNYYVIPSSTQEVMIVPVKNAPNARDILRTLRESNETFVSKEEFLSNRLFMYDRGEGLLAEVKVPNREVDMER